MLGNWLGGCVAFALVLAPQDAAKDKAAKPHVFDRVAVIGASVSAGYRADARLAELLEASFAKPHATPSDSASEMFFTEPGNQAKSQLEAALAKKPTLIVGIDYLFWLGYGDQDFDGKPLASEDARVELLDRGLALLDKLETPLVVGDFPDMSAAVGRMLQPTQMPKAETLTKLNQRLNEWAKTHKNVIVIPLAAWISDLHAKKPIEVGGKQFAPEVTARWLLPDQLHASTEGLAALAARVDQELAARKLLDAKDYVADPTKILERRSAQPAAAGAKSGGK